MTPGHPEDEGPHPVDRHVGGRIRAARKARGLSQEGLAVLLDVSFQQIQKYERGANRVSASRLWEMARALGVPPSYFFEGLSEGADAVAVPLSPEVAGFLLSPEGAELSRLFPTLRERQQVKVLELLRAIASGC